MILADQAQKLEAPAVIKEGLTKDEADALAKTITELGGTVELV